jgi:hypothetical protein
MTTLLVPRFRGRPRLPVARLTSGKKLARPATQLIAPLLANVNAPYERSSFLRRLFVVFRKCAVIGRDFHKAFPLTRCACLRSLLFKQIGFRFVIFRKFRHGATRWNDYIPGQTKARRSRFKFVVWLGSKTTVRLRNVWKRIPRAVFFREATTRASGSAAFQIQHGGLIVPFPRVSQQWSSRTAPARLRVDHSPPNRAICFSRVLSDASRQTSRQERNHAFRGRASGPPASGDTRRQNHTHVTWYQGSIDIAPLGGRR